MKNTFKQLMKISSFMDEEFGIAYMAANKIFFNTIIFKQWPESQLYLELTFMPLNIGKPINII